MEPGHENRQANRVEPQNHLYLIDIGVNLTNDRLFRDFEHILSRAETSRVLDLIITGVDLKSTLHALELCIRFREDRVSPMRLWCTAGIHPHDSATAQEVDFEQLKTLHQRHSDLIVAVGECGLDYERDYSPRTTQRKCFERQLEQAVQLNRPVFLHERGAHQDMLKILKSAGSELSSRSVLHCFTGDQSSMERYLELGCLIGITGWVCDERRGLELKKAVSTLPLDRLLVETDAPYLTPRTLRPRPKKGINEPSFLPHIVQELARSMKRSEEELWEASTRNAERLFRLPPRQG